MNTPQFSPHTATITDAVHKSYVTVDNPFARMLARLGLPFKYNNILEKMGFKLEADVKRASVPSLVKAGFDEEHAHVLLGKKFEKKEAAAPPPEDGDSDDGFGDEASEDEETGGDLTEVERLIEKLELGDPRGLEWNTLRENGVTKLDQLKKLKPIDLMKMHVPQKGVFVMRVHIDEEEKVAEKLKRAKAKQMRALRVTTGRKSSVEAEVLEDFKDHLQVKVAGTKYIEAMFGEGKPQAEDGVAEATETAAPLDAAAVEAMLGPDLTEGL